MPPDKSPTPEPPPLPPLLAPSLFLSRLVVLRHGAEAYDQRFHKGVNIIRGTNSHGKSTIANFIFFVLGGDLSDWKPEAETCDWVLAEVEASGATLTLKREVTKKTSQPLHIYYGPYEDASRQAAQGWFTFSYRRSDSGESFTQALFRALDMPEVSGEGASNLTMHQLLRLIYVDQLTSVDLLLRSEDFDSALIRETVVQYLFGLFDNQLYNDRLELRGAQRQQDIAKAQLKSLERVLDKAEFVTDQSKLRANTLAVEKTLDATNAEIGTLTQQKADTISRKDGFKPLTDELAALRKEAYASSRLVEQLALEIEDSRQFISALQQKLEALDDSLTTRDQLGTISLHFCPQCLAPLKVDTNSSACTLCKQETGSLESLSKLARLRQEIALQIKESEFIATQRCDEYDRNLTLHRSQNDRVKRAQLDFDRLASTSQPQRDLALDQLLQAKGRLERTLDDLRQQLKVLEVVQTLRQESAQWGVRIQELSIAIQRAMRALTAKNYEALAQIQIYTTEFLKSDAALGYEEYFRLSHDISLDLANNSFRLDNRNQFSASSITLLKNSIHFGILFASLDLGYFRYPRLIICDNIEDKGMKPERSQNFQRMVVNLSKRAKAQHQIIFTTSMVAPELDNSDLCVGPNYTNNVKTLIFAAGTPTQSLLPSDRFEKP